MAQSIAQLVADMQDLRARLADGSARSKAGAAASGDVDDAVAALDGAIAALTGAPASAGTDVAAIPLEPPYAVVRDNPGPPDNLKLIRGISSATAYALTTLGITRFAHIAGLTTQDVAALKTDLGYRFTAHRDNWIEQAAILARGGSTSFSRRGGPIVRSEPAPAGAEPAAVEPSVQPPDDQTAEVTVESDTSTDLALPAVLPSALPAALIATTAGSALEARADDVEAKDRDETGSTPVALSADSSEVTDAAVVAIPTASEPANIAFVAEPEPYVDLLPAPEPTQAEMDVAARRVAEWQRNAERAAAAAAAAVRIEREIPELETPDDASRQAYGGMRASKPDDAAGHDASLPVAPRSDAEDGAARAPLTTAAAIGLAFAAGAAGSAQRADTPTDLEVDPGDDNAVTAGIPGVTTDEEFSASDIAGGDPAVEDTGMGRGDAIGDAGAATGHTDSPTQMEALVAQDETSTQNAQEMSEDDYVFATLPEPVAVVPGTDESYAGDNAAPEPQTVRLPTQPAPEVSAVSTVDGMPAETGTAPDESIAEAITPAALIAFPAQPSGLAARLAAQLDQADKLDQADMLDQSDKTDAPAKTDPAEPSHAAGVSTEASEQSDDGPASSARFVEERDDKDMPTPDLAAAPFAPIIRNVDSEARDPGRDTGAVSFEVAGDAPDADLPGDMETASLPDGIIEPIAPPVSDAARASNGTQVPDGAPHATIDPLPEPFSPHKTAIGEAEIVIVRDGEPEPPEYDVPELHDREGGLVGRLSRMFGRKG